MKRIFLRIVSLLCVLLSFAACKKNNEVNNPDNSGDSESIETPVEVVPAYDEKQCIGVQHTSEMALLGSMEVLTTAITSSDIESNFKVESYPYMELYPYSKTDIAQMLSFPKSLTIDFGPTEIDFAGHKVQGVLVINNITQDMINLSNLSFKDKFEVNLQFDSFIIDNVAIDGYNTLKVESFSAGNINLSTANTYFSVLVDAASDLDADFEEETEYEGKDVLYKAESNYKLQLGASTDGALLSGYFYAGIFTDYWMNYGDTLFAFNSTVADSDVVTLVSDNVFPVSGKELFNARFYRTSPATLLDFILDYGKGAKDAYAKISTDNGSTWSDIELSESLDYIYGDPSVPLQVK